MEITITLELTPENLDKLKIFAPEVVAAQFITTPPAQTPEPAADVAPKAAPVQKPVNKVSLTDIRAAATKLAQAGEQQKLVEIFAQFGGKKLSDFNDRADVHPDLLAALTAALGENNG